MVLERNSAPARKASDFSNWVAFSCRRTEAKNAILALLLCGKRPMRGALARDRNGARFFRSEGSDRGDRPRAICRFARPTHPDLAWRPKFRSDEKRIGFAGQLAVAHATALGAEHPVFVAELNLDSIATAQARRAKFRELEKFPAVTRDIAMIVPEELTSRRNRGGDRRREGTAPRAASSCSIFSAESKRKISAREESRWHIVDIPRQNSHTDERRNDRGPREDSRAVAAGVGRGTAGIVL